MDVQMHGRPRAVHDVAIRNTLLSARLRPQEVLLQSLKATQGLLKVLCKILIDTCVVREGRLLAEIHRQSFACTTCSRAFVHRRRLFS